MLNFQNLSLRRKQTLIMVLTSTITLLLACAAFVGFEALNFREEVTDEISTMTQITGNNCAAALDFNDPKAATDTIGALRVELPIASACVYDRRGEVFAVYHRDGGSTNTGFPAVRSPGSEFRDKQLRIFLPILMQGEKVGTIYVACDLYEFNDRLKHFAMIAILVLGISLLTAFLLSVRLQRVISGPVLQLAQAIRKVTLEKEYSVRATKQTNDELGQLVDGFNEMLAQIQQRDAALQSARDELEIRVRGRTADLEKANEALQTENVERKRAEETSRESEEKFRQLAENITDVFWMTSPDMQKIHYVSPAYEQIWGRSAQSSYTNPREWAEAILPEERERVFATFLTLAQEPSASAEFRIARPDGAVRWIFSRGFQVRDSAGKVIRFAGIASDITERKQLEAQLFESQKMETVGKLAGGIAHEFNSILTAIIGRSELLLNDLPSGGADFANAMAIRKAADLAAALTKQLLAYGRKQILRADTLNLNHVLAGMEAMLRHLMGSDVDVLVVTAVGLPVVKADAGQIEQVIMNIAINAREAMHHGGKLTLETSRATLDEEYVRHFPEVKAGDYAMLAISDTGEGMSEEVKAHLFEPFFTTKRVGEGTGLGLATCHGIIKQSGGHINVYSELGRGTTFKIYLPLAELQTEVPTIKPASPALPRGTETILLVEDDPSLREMASLLLRRLGYTVLVAANGPEALNLTRQRDLEHIDLLFTDIVMPQMDGKNLSDQVLAAHPKTKVLFTSAYTETAIVHQGVLDPGVSLLQKPFTPAALALKVRELLDA